MSYVISKEHRESETEVSNMPRGNGTGPQGRRPGSGRGRGGTGRGLGPDANCVCPNCGKKVPHLPGTPCYAMKCPECGAVMVRE